MDDVLPIGGLREYLEAVLVQNRDGWRMSQQLVGAKTTGVKADLSERRRALTSCMSPSRVRTALISPRRGGNFTNFGLASAARIMSKVKASWQSKQEAAA